MTTTSSTSGSSADLYAAVNASSSSASKTSAVSAAAEQSERFLKLLTTQLQNQDPMNPMDNAEMTSQVAQISTVTGIEKMSASIDSLGQQFVAMQAMQGAALVGRNVMAEGNTLSVGSDGKARGGVSLAASASNVTVEVLNAAGKVVRTEQLGAKSAGRNSFEISATGLAQDASYTFRVTAKTGSTDVSTTALMNASVKAVSTSGSTLSLELSNGKTVPYGSVAAIQ